MRTVLLASMLGVLAVGLVAAGDRVPPLPPLGVPIGADSPADPAVADLIKDLGSPDYRTREKAGAALGAKGEKALPDLRKALADADDPEVSRRLAVLVRKM